MRSRAAILPFPGDPFLLYYWLVTFRKHWENEVDKLYIYFNSPIESPVVEYIKKITTYEKIILIYNPLQIDHGEAINKTLDIVREDNIMLIEDDAFIFRPGIVDLCFSKLESGSFDIVGGKRGSCSFEILNKARDKWGLNYEGYGDQGPNFWPCFFFSSKDLLLKTDRNFCGKAWKRGDRLDSLDWTVDVDIVNGDTFVNTSLQLRNIVPESRIYYMPQYHASPDDVADYHNRKNLFDGRCFWLHVGSLSSGISGVLSDEFARPLSRRLLDAPKTDDTLAHYCNTEAEKREWERRVQWWLTFFEYRQAFELPEFEKLYLSAIQRIVRQYDLSWDRIRERQTVYKTLNIV